MPDDATIEQAHAYLSAAQKVMKTEFPTLLFDNADATVNFARFMFEISQSTKGAK